MRMFTLGLVLVFAGCATSPVPKVEHVVQCTEQALVSQWQPILGEVIADLPKADYAVLLESLATRVGRAAVTCAVQDALTKRKALPGTEDTTREHGLEYLRTHQA